MDLNVSMQMKTINANIVSQKTSVWINKMYLLKEQFSPITAATLNLDMQL